MKRRDVLTSIVASGLAAPVFAAQAHDHSRVAGPLATATVSFGYWPLVQEGVANSGNRFTVPNAPAARNGHALVPYESTIKAGGTVNFIVAGFHLIAVYKDGTTLADIDVTKIVEAPPGFIDDGQDRVYFGLDPRTMPQDRVEVVHFPDPGRYLVICAVLPHFAPDPPVHEPMHGWVRVLP